MLYRCLYVLWTYPCDIEVVDNGNVLVTLTTEPDSRVRVGRREVEATGLGAVHDIEVRLVQDINAVHDPIDVVDRSFTQGVVPAKLPAAN